MQGDPLDCEFHDLRYLRVANCTQPSKGRKTWLKLPVWGEICPCFHQKTWIYAASRLGAMVAHRSCKAGVTGSSPVVGSLVLSLECNTHRVDAVAISGWSLRRIIKNMSQVRAALLAAHLGTEHAVSAVLYILNCLVTLGLIEAGPSAVGVKLGVRFKEECIAAPAVVASRALFFE